MRLNIPTIGAALLFCAAAAAQADQPPAFNSLQVGVDGEGFITLQEGLTPAERFFPLGVFFYPALPGETDDIPGDPYVDYYKFASMRGNLVVAPWVMNQWPQRPGAVFKDAGVCHLYMAAAGRNDIKMIADPTLFWGKGGVWGDDGAVVSDADRQTWFNEASSWVVDSEYANVFMGYYNWDEPAWRYYACPMPPSRPTPAYIAAASARVNALEAGVGADHAIYMAQRDNFKVRDLWPDYNSAADIVGGYALPFPAPDTLQGRNENTNSAERGCLLPNYNASVSGSIEDAVYEAARYAAAGGPRNKPYIAVLQAKK